MAVVVGNMKHDIYFREKGENRPSSAGTWKQEIIGNIRQHFNLWNYLYQGTRDRLPRPFPQGRDF